MGISHTHGKWFVILTLYFILIGTALFFIVEASTHYDIDNDANTIYDPSVQRRFNPIEEGCSGTPNSESLTRCEYINNANTNETCLIIPGCSWVDGTFTSSCQGNVNSVFASDNPTCDNFNISVCSVYAEDGCAWQGDNSGFEDGYSQKKTLTMLKETFSFFIGFNSNLGLGGWVQFLISTLFFWIPTLLYIYVIYAIVREAIGFT